MAAGAFGSTPPGPPLCQKKTRKMLRPGQRIHTPGPGPGLLLGLCATQPGSAGRRYLYFGPANLASEAQGTIRTAKAKAEASAKAAAAAAEQKAVGLLPWDNSKHVRKDPESACPWE